MIEEIRRRVAWLLDGFEMGYLDEAELAVSLRTLAQLVESGNLSR